MVYITFLLSLDIGGKKSKNRVFFAYTISWFFSILTKYLGQKKSAKTNYTPFCSPFNSASIHIWDIISKHSHGELSQLEYRPLTSNFTYIRCYIELILKIFFFKLFHCSNRVIYQSIEFHLLYKMIYMTFLLSLDTEVKKSKYCIFLTSHTIYLSIILMKCQWQKMITSKLIASSCSPFNSASNDI